ncbi:src-like-adapter 2 [Petromyzon marinus]|uniref:Src-like-adapter 2 n=1 Tax=Petromyzon marinus TaxID=7757 RepID=A0AAJ7X1D6_PETMA|nr:src-like-adapter 2 [Petromyzon marinus]
MGATFSAAKQRLLSAFQATQHAAPPPDLGMAVIIKDFPEWQPLFAVGDKVKITGVDGDWWKVMSICNNREAFIPASHTVKVKNRWLFEALMREDAERILLMDGNHGGSFLVRTSTSNRNMYALSVRRQRPSGAPDVIKHYRIHMQPNGTCYISQRAQFESLEELVDHYMEQDDDVCKRLREPCFSRLPGESRRTNVALPPPPKAEPLRDSVHYWQSLHRQSRSTCVEVLSANRVSYGLLESMRDHLNFSGMRSDS